MDQTHDTFTGVFRPRQFPRLLLLCDTSYQNVTRFLPKWTKPATPSRERACFSEFRPQQFPLITPLLRQGPKCHLLSFQLNQTHGTSTGTRELQCVSSTTVSMRHTFVTPVTKMSLTPFPIKARPRHLQGNKHASVSCVHNNFHALHFYYVSYHMARKKISIRF